MQKLGSVTETEISSKSLVIGVYVRNSTRAQVGNPRSEWQMDMVAHVQNLGFSTRVYEEWGVPGTTLARRPKLNELLIDLQAGKVHGIAVAELSRLTRDTRGVDPAFIAYLLKRYATGRLITFGHSFDLRRTDDQECTTS
jgi:hypothetical protein